MTDNQSNNKKIAKNTIVLYFRMMIILAINLYISRAVLNTMGTDDFGIYNVVGGFVTMFTLITGSLTNAIGRYITFELGRGDIKRLNHVFSTSVTVQMILSIIVILLLETVGLWFLNCKMQIPTDRITAANWVLQCSILTFVLNLISVPYNGCLIAHERMTAYAYISILEVLLKLASVLILFLNVPDKLITYAFLLSLSSIIIRLIYGIYCSRNFEECQYRFFLDKPLVREMTQMASWNMIGSGASILNQQGVNLLINVFFGVAVNAARGLAVQVNAAVQQFAGSFITAINPQITKTYSVGDYDKMRTLVYSGFKYSYFLMYLLTLPLVFTTPFILKLWLNTVPDYTVLFVRLTLLGSLIVAPSSILFTVAMATGEIKHYQLIVGACSLMCFVVTFVAYWLGGDVELTYYIWILVDIAVLFARLFIVNKLVSLKLKDFIKSVLTRIFMVSVLSACVPFLMYNIIPKSTGGFMLLITSCFCATLLFINLIGLNHRERVIIINTLKSKFQKNKIQ